MLLVIFGAGASYDSVLPLPPPSPPTTSQSNYGFLSSIERGPHEDSRPPLANQLFDDRGLFVQVMNEYVACKPLVNLLRGNIQFDRQFAGLQGGNNLLTKATTVEHVPLTGEAETF